MLQEVPTTVREWCNLLEEKKHRTLPAKYCIEECENLCLKGEIAVQLSKEGLSYEEIENRINLL